MFSSELLVGWHFIDIALLLKLSSLLIFFVRKRTHRTSVISNSIGLLLLAETNEIIENNVFMEVWTIVKISGWKAK